MPRRAARARPTRPAAPPRRRLGLVALGIAAAVALLVAAWAFSRPTARTLAARAEAAARAGDWDAALAQWRALNRTGRADAGTWLGEARAALALGRAAQGERALIRAGALDPADPEPWLLRLELLRLEDRQEEARRVGWAAYEAVPPPSRREVLRALTLALLAEPPADLARATLDRWIAADPDDLDARVARIALERRLAARPRAVGNDRDPHVDELERLLARDPAHVGAREALVIALADAGRADRGAQLLDAWPAAARDARYWRLRGRWELEQGDDPAAAVTALERALLDLPHDWKARSLLARAFQGAKQLDAARRAAADVSRLREALDPATVGPRLDADLANLDDPAARRDLAELCDRVGLDRLADAWRRDAGGS